MRHALCCAAILASLTSLLTAQEFRATITGHVVDQSGLVVPNTTVRAVNSGTNATSSATTNAQGVYTLPQLEPGSYTVTAEASGFKRYIRQNITLNVGDVAGVDIEMDVGATTESITVTAETPILQTESANKGLVIDQIRVTELPLNTRNPFMLANLAAGVNFNGNPIYMRPFDNGAIADWSVNGGLDRKNEFLLDGAPNNAQAGGNNIALVPPVDSVQEFKIQTNTYDAEYGKSAGGIVNVGTKSGTNQYHGTGYEFARRSALDANSFQNNATSTPKAGHYLDQYGGSIGGPLTVPKVYSGHDRTFFFFNYEGYREGTPSPLTLSVPTAAERAGDFSGLVDSQGRPITIYNPFTAVINSDGTVTRQPFAGNIIPANLLNPVALKILNAFPLPNTTTPGSAYGVNNYFVGGANNVDADRFYNYVFKVDEALGAKNHIWFRNASNDRTEHRNTNGVLGPGWQGPGPLKRINDAYALDFSRVITPTLLADARVSFSRYVEGSRGDPNIGFNLASLGLSPALISQLPVQNEFGIYTFTGYTGLGTNSNFNYTNTLAFAANTTKIAGAHSLKAGVDLRWIQYNVINQGNIFNLTANPTWTQQQYNKADALSGNTFASFVLGLPSSGAVDNTIYPSWLDRYFAPYFQDDWKVTRKLTLNLGVRWDFFPAVQERYNRLAAGFDISAINPVNAAAQAAVPGFNTVRGGLVYLNQSGATNQKLDLSGLQPRFGLAYQINNRMVFRGGWGRYMVNPNNDNLRSEGYSITTSSVTSLNSGRTPAATDLLTNPFSSGILLPSGSSNGLASLLGQNISFFNPNFHIPYSEQFSAGFQIQLPLRSNLDVSYVGNRGYKLQTSNNLNQLPLSVRQSCDIFEGGNPLYCDAQVTNPFYNLPQFTGTTIGSSPTISRYQASLPYPQFGTVWEYGRNDGKLWYNALQLTYSIRAFNGLNVTFAYTRSKSIEQGGFDASNGNNANEAFLDFQRGVYERSVSAYDTPNQVKLSTVYQVPVGRGKQFLSTAPRVVDWLIGGWEHTMIFQYTSGKPWTLPLVTAQTAGNIPQGVEYVRNAQVPINWTAPVVQGARPCVAQVNDNGSITLEAFSAALPGCGLDNYNFLIEPRYAPYTNPLRDSTIRLNARPELDMSLSKSVHIHERMSLQFRAEAFNLTNSFWLPLQQYNNTPTSSNFGQIIQSTVSSTNSAWPRQIQLALKFIF